MVWFVLVILFDKDVMLVLFSFDYVEDLKVVLVDGNLLDFWYISVFYFDDMVVIV